MAQSGGFAARPDGSISASVACGGSEITWAHPNAVMSAKELAIKIELATNVMRIE
jgi:hypothetical protein